MNKICGVLSQRISVMRGENSSQYLSRLYPIFVNDFKINHPTFKGKNVLFNTLPIIHGYEEAFFHMTHVDLDKTGFENRQIDYARSECIHWITEILNAHPCRDTSCNGIKVWRVNKRIHILCEKERFLFVIEKRNNYYRFVSSFILNFARSLQGKLDQYEKYKGYPL